MLGAVLPLTTVEDHLDEQVLLRGPLFLKAPSRIPFLFVLLSGLPGKEHNSL